jgi:hypothetical protein
VFLRPTEINGDQPASQQCSICDRPLLHPASIERGYCERCHLNGAQQGDAQTGTA